MNGVIYKKTSPSGKSYIGQTWCYENRMSKYRARACKNQPAIYNAINKYGIDNFAEEILESGIKTQEELDAREVYWIAALNTLAPNGYNMTAGGGGCVGRTLSPEHRAKIGARIRGKPKSPEHRVKLSDANKGKTHSAETRAKQSKAVSGKRNPNFGKTASPETRAKMSASQRGKPAWNKGKTTPPEVRAKQSAAKMGNQHARKTNK